MPGTTSDCCTRIPANSQPAIDAFRRVTEIDPNDADTWYFLGAAYAQNKQYPRGDRRFPACAESSIRCMPRRSSDSPAPISNRLISRDAREHLTRFQYITQNKLGSPISLAYGEQGKYSLCGGIASSRRREFRRRFRCALWM